MEVHHQLKRAEESGKKEVMHIPVDASQKGYDIYIYGTNFSQPGSIFWLKKSILQMKFSGLTEIFL